MNYNIQQESGNSKNLLSNISKQPLISYAKSVQKQNEIKSNNLNSILNKERFYCSTCKSSFSNSDTYNNHFNYCNDKQDHYSNLTQTSVNQSAFFSNKNYNDSSHQQQFQTPNQSILIENANYQ